MRKKGVGPVKRERIEGGGEEGVKEVEYGDGAGGNESRKEREGYK